jgi:putative DNA primase/helicase
MAQEDQDRPIPYQTNGSKASATDPSTWNTFEIAKGAVSSNAGGIGIVTDGSFIGFDLDGCRNPETNEIKEWAQRIINSLGTYTEVTPSG